MAWDDGLVGTARDIAATDRTPLRVMAGPGTGKSFAMKRRAARLLEEGQNPRRILAITFTRTWLVSLKTYATLVCPVQKIYAREHCIRFVLAC
jgi:hypothetical protein